MQAELEQSRDNSRHDNHNEQRLDEIYAATRKDAQSSIAAYNGAVFDRPACLPFFDFVYAAQSFQRLVPPIVCPMGRNHMPYRQSTVSAIAW